ncbi:MAG: hypothetical protein JSW47_04710 [Phycisphaerales bacterium]|nr:MAG: hypothetical protein JSW47_04710 [Phycisphaerales bacterium]
MLDIEVFAANWPANFRAVAHWKLDETQGAVARDRAGNNDGILHGGPSRRPSGGTMVERLSSTALTTT